MHYNIKLRKLSTLAIIQLLAASSLFAQDLDPRAYVRVPVKTTTLISGFVFSHGGIVTDPTLPIENLEAKVQAASLGVAHSFSIFGLSSQALVALPYTWAQVSGLVAAQDTSTSRSGFADMRLRLSVLLLGGKAGTIQEIVKAPRKTILGVSLNVVAPTGEFLHNKLINIGTNRWAFRPEIALSQPIGKRWTIDVYSGLWLFTNNNGFYPGKSVRSQDPMGAFQAHFSYNIKPVLWVAFDATYYVGGQSAIDEQLKDDRQSNARIGLTAVVPTGKLSNLKFAASTGAIVRIGQNFTTYSLGYQKSWIGGMKKK